MLPAKEYINGQTVEYGNRKYAVITHGSAVWYSGSAGDGSLSTGLDFEAEPEPEGTGLKVVFQDGTTRTYYPKTDTPDLNIDQCDKRTALYRLFSWYQEQYAADGDPLLWWDVLSGQGLIDLSKIDAGQGPADIGKPSTLTKTAMWVSRELFNHTGRTQYISDDLLFNVLLTIAEEDPINPFLRQVQKWAGEDDPGDLATAYSILANRGFTTAGLLHGEQETAYLEKLIQAYCLAVIERQIRPCIVDFAICMIGKQGAGKSSLCRAMGLADETTRGFFRSTAELSDLQKLIESTRGGVILEMAEGTQLYHCDAIKAYLDESIVQYRDPYAKRESDHPITSVTIITTNHENPLQDLTGSRRIWPVYATGEIAPGWEPGSEELPKQIRVLWARAWKDYANGLRWRTVLKEIEKEGKKLQDAFTRSAPGQDILIEDLQEYARYDQAGEKEPRISRIDVEAMIKNENRFSLREAEDVLKTVELYPDRYGLVPLKGKQRIRGKSQRGYRIVIESDKTAD